MAVIAAALPVATWTTFDYWAPDTLRAEPGSIVRVPLGRRKVLGVVTSIQEHSEIAADKLQPVDCRVERRMRGPPARWSRSCEFASTLGTFFGDLRLRDRMTPQESGAAA